MMHSLPRHVAYLLARWRGIALPLFAAAAVGLPASHALAQINTSSASQSTATDDTSSGTVRLRSSSQAAGIQSGGLMSNSSTLRTVARPEYKPGEFEKFVQKLADPTWRAEAERRTDESKNLDAQSRQNGQVTPTTSPVKELPVIRRFGADLMLPMFDEGDPIDQATNIPGDYLIKPGDELVVTLWGSVDGDVRTIVDRAGRITIPRVGPVLVSGVKYADLPDVIGRRVSQIFRNFQVSASLGQLRGVRVYVTGYVTQPGAYNINSLSTLVTALSKAGGPSAAGSFRDVQLKRNGQVVSTFDLYDFLLKGDKSADRLLEAGDVVHVGPVGPQVALIGSVNQPSIFELKAGETVSDVLRMAGGFTAVADRSRLSVERLDDRADRRIRQLALPTDAIQPLSHGDVIRAFSAVDTLLPVQRQNKRIRIEGEVLRPGQYVLPPETTVGDAIAAAGGMTPFAYPFGAEFTRESVRVTQSEQYDRALRDLETEFARNSSSQRTSNSEEAAAVAARGAATTRLVERLRAVRPNGRIVLQLDPATSMLPPLALEDGDRLYIPPRPSTVGVFGSVFNGGSYLFTQGRTANDYLQLAGGPTRGADEASVFVIRANGSVVSSRQTGGWLGRSSGLETLTAEPGDTIFVPEEMNKTTFTQNLKDWTQIIYQFGLGIAGIKALGL